MRVGKSKLTTRHPLFGQILLSQSKITVDQLDKAVAKQAGSGTYIGEVLVRMGAVAPADIVEALRIQADYYPDGDGP
jgi:hypothetical protein